MKNIIKILTFIFFTINLNANILIYNYTPEILSASFYYGNTAAKMEFTVKAGESTESAIPSWKTSRRTLKISTTTGKELILKPLEWLTDHVFYIVAENSVLKAYSQEQWNNLSEDIKKTLKPEATQSFFRLTPIYKNKEIELEATIPDGANKNDWTLISNQCDTKIYAAFYYQGKITNTLKKAHSPIYAIKEKSAGYAQLPPSRFIIDGPRVIVYAEQPTPLVPIITKENYQTIKGIVAVGLGEGSIALLAPESNNPEIKKTIQSIKIKPLDIILKSDTTLYYALYQPIYKGLLKSAKNFFKEEAKKEIEKFQRYKGPEKMIPHHKITTEGSQTALVAFSANANSLSEFLTQNILEGSKDITYIRCNNNEYLVVAKPSDTIFIYTPEQWKDALIKSSPSKKNYTSKIGAWLVNKIFGINIGAKK